MIRSLFWRPKISTNFDIGGFWVRKQTPGWEDWFFNHFNHNRFNSALDCWHRLVIHIWSVETSSEVSFFFFCIAKAFCSLERFFFSKFLILEFSPTLLCRALSVLSYFRLSCRHNMFKIYPHSFNGVQIRGTVRAFPKASVCSAPWWILDGHFHVSFSFSHGFLADCTTFGSRICQYLFFFYTCNVSSSPGFHTCYSWHDILLLQRILNSKLVLTLF